MIFTASASEELLSKATCAKTEPFQAPTVLGLLVVFVTTITNISPPVLVNTVTIIPSPSTTHSLPFRFQISQVILCFFSTPTPHTHTAIPSRWAVLAFGSLCISGLPLAQILIAPCTSFIASLYLCSLTSTSFLPYTSSFLPLRPAMALPPSWPY